MTMSSGGTVKGSSRDDGEREIHGGSTGRDSKGNMYDSKLIELQVSAGNKRIKERERGSQRTEEKTGIDGVARRGNMLLAARGTAGQLLLCSGVENCPEDSHPAAQARTQTCSHMHLHTPRNTLCMQRLCRIMPDLTAEI